MDRWLALSLLLCLAVSCSGDRRHSVKQDGVSREKFNHNDGKERNPVEVYLKLSDNPQLFVAKKGAGFLFTTTRPGSSDRKTCEQCVFRIVCEGPDCAEVCELCGSHASEGSNAKFDSASCSVSREEEKPSRTNSLKGEQKTVTSSTKSGASNEKELAKSDERFGPVRKWMNARREFRRKQLAERNKQRLEARKSSTSRGRTEMDTAHKITTPLPKTSKHSNEHGAKVTNFDNFMTTKPTFDSKSEESIKPLEHFKGKSEESHENEVVFSIPKKKTTVAHEEHEIPSSKRKNSSNEDDLSDSSKILKLLEKIIQQRELENKMKDESKNVQHKTHPEVDRKEVKTKKTSVDGSGSHGSTLEHDNEKEKPNHKAKHSDEFDEDPMVQSHIGDEQMDSWPHVMGKLLQTEIESAFLLVKQKPLKSALKNLKERCKPIFIAASKALAKVFGVHATDEEQIKAKKEKDAEVKSSPTTLAPPPTTTAIPSKHTAKDAHLSNGTAAKADAHRRRAFIYSARTRPRHRQRRSLSLRASVKNKLLELETLDKSVSAEGEKSQPAKGCSCNCFASRRNGPGRRTNERHLGR
uniref:Uncharacterized protein n=1 Tax=Anopheles culicifacies TaxID=139723 RepID=A0A182MNP6_9DIPT